MSKIVYLSHYDVAGKRNISPAAVTMMEYIIESIARTGRKFTVLSAAQAKDGEALQREETIDKNVNYLFVRSLKCPGRHNYIKRFIRKIRQINILEKELDSLLNDGDVLVVYHSLALIEVVKRIRKRKKIKLILQVCEIYSDVTGNKAARKKEIEYTRLADAYIFSTDMLKKQINQNNKKHIICLGSYTLNDMVGNTSNFERASREIHCVYAGTFDPRKGGAAAVAAAQFLPSNYHIHVLGFGSTSETEQIKKLIDTISLNSKAKVTYDGLLRGEDYLAFIQNCDVGLSTQNPDAAFNSTSFPSKILSYMSNGLRVVSVRIPAIENSAVGEYLFYYDEQTPEKIAEAIMKVNLKDEYNGPKIISDLDNEFCADLLEMLRYVDGDIRGMEHN